MAIKIPTAKTRKSKAEVQQEFEQVREQMAEEVAKLKESKTHETV